MGGFLGSLDPVSAVLGGVSAVTNAFTAYQNSKNVKKQIQAQKEENALNRQFNHDEAELSRQYNTEMVDKANAYNTPQANVQRLMDAGLHPSLAYGNLGNTAMVTGSTSQQASTQNSVSPVIPDLSSLSNIAKDIAEIDLIKAQTKKTESDTELNDVELQFASELKQGELKLQSANIRLSESSSSLNNSTIQLQAKEIGEIFARTQQLYTDLDNANIDNWFRTMHQQFYLQDESGERLAELLNSRHFREVYESADVQFRSQITKEQALLAKVMFLADLRERYARSSLSEWQAESIRRTIDTTVENLRKEGYNIDYRNDRLFLENVNFDYILGAQLGKFGIVNAAAVDLTQSRRRPTRYYRGRGPLKINR